MQKHGTSPPLPTTIHPGLTGYFVFHSRNVLSFNGPEDQIQNDLTRLFLLMGHGVYVFGTFFFIIFRLYTDEFRLYWRIRGN